MTASSDANRHLLAHNQKLQRKAELEWLELQIRNQRRTGRWLPWVILLLGTTSIGFPGLIRHSTGRFDHSPALTCSPLLGYLLSPGIAAYFRARTPSGLIKIEAPDYHHRLKERGLI